jgi:hypothetical protein
MLTQEGTDMSELTRTCTDCQAVKPLEDFPLTKSDVYSYRKKFCKECFKEKKRLQRLRRIAADPTKLAKENEQKKIWEAQNPEKVKLIRLRNRAKKRGIDTKFIEEYYLVHSGKCEICYEKPSRELAIDHCHQTGVFRGLLCNRCNLVLGQVEDSYFILQNMLEYIGKHLDKVIDQPMSYDNPVAEERILNDIKGQASGEYRADPEYLKQLLDMLVKLRNPEFR